MSAVFLNTTKEPIDLRIALFDYETLNLAQQTTTSAPPLCAMFGFLNNLFLKWRKIVCVKMQKRYFWIHYL